MQTMDALILSPRDDVAVATTALDVDAIVRLSDGREVRGVDAIGLGHKIAVRDMPAGHRVRKYGQVIGRTTTSIAVGAHVHAHNLAMDEGDRDPVLAVEPIVPAHAHEDRPTFLGYRRANGRAGTRNYIGIVTSVNCSATTARLIASHFGLRELEAFPNVDGVMAITHNSGCGIVSDSEGARMLVRTLRGYAEHPNFAAILLLGLGCEMVTLDLLAQSLDGTVIDRLNIQESGGVRSTVAMGIERITAMLPVVDATQRIPIGAEEIILGLNCGGSDGLSGITANPALGLASDRLVSWGGASVLAETPEIYGAEHLLTGRALDPAIGRKLADRLDWWRDYVAAGQGTLDNNPSPGNKQGGLTTILEKSLGAVAKAGSAPLVDVLEYAERITQPGLSFMDTPGYDPVSVTGLVAGGANVVVFTTGRGSAFGCKPVPSIKVASNSALARRMPDDIDLDAGIIIEGVQSMSEVADTLFTLILDVASGTQTASEAIGAGQDEFVPWHIGAVT